MSRLELRLLSPEDEASFRKAVDSFQDDVPPVNFAFEFDGEIPFPDYIEKLESWTRGENLPDRFVPNSFFVGVVNGQVVGRLSLRHCLNDFLERVGGHIGYAVVPAHRRKGYATEMLRQALPIAASLGIKKVLLTCDIDNVGSRVVIEQCGGIFENITNEPDLEVQKRRYWIDVEKSV